MPWFVVDDNADSHPKMIAAGNPGLGLWLKCGAYASRHLTDGIVPGVIAKMYGSKLQIGKLLAAGLWHEHGHTCTHPKCLQPAPGDYAIHDYLIYNPTRAKVTEQRERAAEKKRKQRAAQEGREEFAAETPPNRTSDPGRAAGQGSASPGDSGGTRPRGNPSPPRPSPEGRAESESPAGRSSRAPVSLISADWQPTDDDVQAAQLARADAGREQLTPAQIVAVTRKFRQRMSDDQVRAAGFGGRWQQWAENERVDTSPPVGGEVIPFGRRAPQQQTDDLFGAAMQRAQARMTQEGGAAQ